jgi:hypothetical protein
MLICESWATGYRGAGWTRLRRMSRNTVHAVVPRSGGRDTVELERSGQPPTYRWRPSLATARTVARLSFGRARGGKSSRAVPVPNDPALSGEYAVSIRVAASPSQATCRRVRGPMAAERPGARPVSSLPACPIRPLGRLGRTLPPTPRVLLRASSLETRTLGYSSRYVPSALRAAGFGLAGVGIHAVREPGSIPGLPGGEALGLWAGPLRRRLPFTFSLPAPAQRAAASLGGLGHRTFDFERGSVFGTITPSR